jgi:heme-degrading monooxygenase HmoA
MMIVRTWHGCVPLQHRQGFAEHLNVTGVQHARRIAGNCGAFVRQEVQGDYAHFFLATYWESLEAIKHFAGEVYQVAVTYPDDEAFALISDPYVFHHQVDEIIAL